MLQVYPFTGEGTSATLASTEARNKLNHFLAMDVETSLIEVTNVLQSESSCVSVWESINDWNYSFSISLVCNVHPTDLDKIHKMYLAS